MVPIKGFADICRPDHVDGARADLPVLQASNLPNIAVRDQGLHFDVGKRS